MATLKDLIKAYLERMARKNKIKTDDLVTEILIDTAAGEVENTVAKKLTKKSSK